MNIPFNLPHLTGKEAHYMYQTVYNSKMNGNGEFTKRCQHHFEKKCGFKKTFLIIVAPMHLGWLPLYAT